MKQRMSVARCCCDKERPDLLPISYGREGLIDPLSSGPILDSYEFNGACIPSPVFGPIQVGERRSLGRNGTDTYSFRMAMEEFSAGTSPAPQSFPTLIPATLANFIIEDGASTTDPIVGQIELRCRRLSNTAGYCAAVAGDYYTTIPTGNIRRRGTTNDLRSDLIDITDLIQEVRVSAEYIATPTAIPLWVIDPIVWDADVSFSEFSTIQGTFGINGLWQFVRIG